MKKRKKFDGGGSVMDEPSRDMRDPEYRRRLEREQALQEPPISPEDVFFPGLRKAAYVAKTMAKGERLAARAKPDISKISEKWNQQDKLAANEKRVQDYYNKEHQKLYGTPEKRAAAARAEAESDHFNPKGPYKKSTDTLADRVEKEGKEAFQKRYIDEKVREVVSATKKEAEQAVAKRKAIRAIKGDIKDLAIPRSAGALGSAAMELEDRASGALRRLSNQDTDEMKKGGRVKAKSASARADGCAIRGKTRA